MYIPQNNVKTREFSDTSQSHPSKILILNAWVVENLDLPRFKINSNTIRKQWNHLQDIQIEVDNSQEISILIGADYPHLHISKDVRIGNDNEPIAISTLLGWVLLGGKNGTNYVRTNFMVKETELLSNTVEKFWSLESYGTFQKDDVSVLPLQEQKALETLENTVQFVDNHYSFGLLWKENKPTLTYNKSPALSRFHSLENKFKQHPEFADKYKSTVKDYISEGHAVMLLPEEARDRSPVTNYVPHHGVTNVNKPGKVRVVFDVAEQFDKTCLNEKLLKGSDYLNNSIGILLRFRREPYAVISDIEQMYHQIKVAENDQDALRFVWRNNTDEEIVDLMMKVHIFGKVDSPCISNWVITRTASAQSSQYENEIIERIQQNFYMDDYLDCFPSQEKAIETVRKVIKILSTGGFRLTKWLSNGKHNLKTLTPAERSPKVVNLDLSDIPIERALGIIWDPQEDILQIKTINKDSMLTKRGLLSFMTSLYDPIRIISPLMLEPKLIIPELWRRNLAWDEQLPEDIKQRWIAWKRNIPSLAKIKIPRWYGFTATDMVQLELHVFFDGSQCAYGAVVYIRYILNKSVTSNFVPGKPRLAPIKKSSMSIPKLELQAAVIGVRLKTTVMEEVNLEIKKVFCWCDSKTVLIYIRNEHSNFGVYVAHRINEIRENSSVSQWHYIPSNMNVADDSTMCISFKQFGSNSRWFTGPSLLLNATSDDFLENIVSTVHIPETLTEVNVISNNLMISDIYKSKFNWEYYSDLDKMIKHLHGS